MVFNSASLTRSVRSHRWLFAVLMVLVMLHTVPMCHTQNVVQICTQNGIENIVVDAKTDAAGGSSHQKNTDCCGCLPVVFFIVPSFATAFKKIFFLFAQNIRHILWHIHTSFDLFARLRAPPAQFI